MCSGDGENIGMAVTVHMVWISWTGPWSLGLSSYRGCWDLQDPIACQCLSVSVSAKYR